MVIALSVHQKATFVQRHTHAQEVSIWSCAVPPKNTRATDVPLLNEAQPAGQGASGNVEDAPVLPFIY